jgi:hypothetical protein
LQGEADRDRAMRRSRTTEVAAAVQIKKNNVAYVWPYDPFSGNAVNLRRGNADRRWDSVGIGPENFSRTAVVTNTAELALDAPFDDPNGKMCLEAGHRLLLSHLGA